MGKPCDFKKLLTIGGLIVFVALTFIFPHPATANDLDLTTYVNPFIGTSGSGWFAGNTFPGAVVPNGMVQFSPDTSHSAGGYRYQDQSINAFSLTHFSGRGVVCWQDIGLMPIVGPLGGSPGTHWSSYASPFSHTHEAASPGYYHVQLDKYGIQTDLTVTPRTGDANFTFPPSTAATLLINAGHSAQANSDVGTGLTIVGNNQVTGSASSGNCGGNFIYTVYFAAQFEPPFSSFGTWQGGQVTPGSLSSNGAHSGAYLTFDTTANPVVQAKIGISFVSVANAQANLTSENPNWDFGAIHSTAKAAWNKRLNSIQVQGGSTDEQTIFYTGLYHASIHPNIFSDSNGQYLGFDNQIHTSNRVQYENLSSWDHYRSLMPLLALIAPQEAADMVQSLVNDAQQDPGGGLPRWQQANTNSGGMIGDGPLPSIASVYAFGVTNFDTAGALAAMVKDASVVGTTSNTHLVRNDLADYLSRGYIPEPSTNVWGSAATTLEYATDDFALSQFAKASGDTTSYRTFLTRAQNWKNLFDPAAGGYLVPRDAAGNFIPFQPTSQTGFVEGTAPQYLWMVPFNYRTLFQMLGGNAQAVARLDNHFTELNAGPDSAYAFMGNEPEAEVPWAYDFAGAPYRTQDTVRRILLQVYANSPSGLPGNDDGGAMGSWTVFACMGLYPDIPGVGGFTVGSPLFTSISIRLANGSSLDITAPAASDTNRYVQSLTLNGTPYLSPWLDWTSLASGATLTFTLGPDPNLQWGSAPADAPPSFDVDAALRDYIGVFRPSNGTFYLRNSNTTGPADISAAFGAPGDLPVSGDWNGDGIDTIGVYRPGTSQFLLKDSNTTTAPIDYSFFLGEPGDLPVVGDWNGSGKEGVGVFHPSTGLLSLKTSLTTGFANYQMVLGLSGDVPVSGDWNGDGVDSPGVYRPANTTFYLTDEVCNCKATATYQATLGLPGDSPLADDWNNDGSAGIGVFRPSNGLIYLKNTPTTGFADLQIVFGLPNDKPIAGHWAASSVINKPSIAPTFVP